jgi:tRNA (guanine37-N1)-methyltransferase
VLRFDVVTIFPEVYESPLRVSLLGKAIAGGLVEVGIHDLRAWGQGPHRKVDDTPFGGGAGMVMTPGPVVAAVEAVRRPSGRVVLLSAAGRRFDQPFAAELAAEEQVVVICGRYEGMDDRVAGLVGAEAVSIGDFVLAGGDVAALVVIEAVARLVPGVLGNLDSLAEESFTGGLLEYPQYTRPAEIGGLKVPEVLLSGDHGRIARWRRQQSLRRTFEQRPDLIDAAIRAGELSDDERDLVAEWRALLSSNSRPFTGRE